MSRIDELAALELAGIDRNRAYVTNAVKHFRWERTPGGKDRERNLAATVDDLRTVVRSLP